MVKKNTQLDSKRKCSKIVFYLSFGFIYLTKLTEISL